MGRRLLQIPFAAIRLLIRQRTRLLASFVDSLRSLSSGLLTVPTIVAHFVSRSSIVGGRPACSTYIASLIATSPSSPHKELPQRRPPWSNKYQQEGQSRKIWFEQRVREELAGLKHDSNNLPTIPFFEWWAPAGLPHTGRRGPKGWETH
jgi:hypothetical protein